MNYILHIKNPKHVEVHENFTRVVLVCPMRHINDLNPWFRRSSVVAVYLHTGNKIQSYSVMRVGHLDCADRMIFVDLQTDTVDCKSQGVEKWKTSTVTYDNIRHTTRLSFEPVEYDHSTSVRAITKMRHDEILNVSNYLHYKHAQSTSTYDLTEMYTHNTLSKYATEYFDQLMRACVLSGYRAVYITKGGLTAYPEEFTIGSHSCTMRRSLRDFIYLGPGGGGANSYQCMSMGAQLHHARFGKTWCTYTGTELDMPAPEHRYNAIWSQYNGAYNTLASIANATTTAEPCSVEHSIEYNGNRRNITYDTYDYEVAISKLVFTLVRELKGYRLLQSVKIYCGTSFVFINDKGVTGSVIVKSPGYIIRKCKRYTPATDVITVEFGILNPEVCCIVRMSGIYDAYDDFANYISESEVMARLTYA